MTRIISASALIFPAAEVRPHVFPAARAAWARLVGDVGMDRVFDCNSNHLWVIAFEQRVALLPSVLSGLIGQLRRMVTPHIISRSVPR